LDNFWDATSTYNSIAALLTGSNFHIATTAELLVLQASIPAVPANFAAETLIAGGNYIGNPHPGVDRGLMWGIFEDGDISPRISYSWKFDTDINWNVATNAIAATDTLRSQNTLSQDLGAWIVSNGPLGGTAPEAASLAVWSVLIVLGTLRLSRMRNAVK
jgi:hypothetical protein